MILVMGTIFFLSHQPGDSIDLGNFPGIDKVAHLAVYGLLALTVILAHSASARKKTPTAVCLSTCVICLLYGISDEFHQSFIPGRFVSGADVLADMVGAVTACCGWLVLYRFHLVRRVR
jgi:VanZ family protein